ncbi:MAG: DUF4302 domain-containing protein [Ekhidna sp.]|nr:DUF4302 domain-containing protein [Ekhidna sp.]
MKKIIQHYLSQKYLAFMFGLVLIVTSCSDDETTQPLFDKSAEERVQAEISVLRNTLLESEFGWVASYRPAEETGYFRFLFKFEEDGTVETQTNFDSNLFGDDAGRRSVSEYEIVQGSTTKLSFTTEGLIHRLSDSNFSPIPGRGNGGSGLKGDFEFLYFGKSDNGDTLAFRANRTQPDNNTQYIVRFVRAGSESENSLSTDPINDIGESTQKSVYQALVYDPGSGGEQLTASVDYNTRLRTLTMRRLIEESDTSYFEDEYVAGMDYLSGNRIRLDSLRLGENELFRDVILQYDQPTGFFNSVEINGESDSRISIGSRDKPFILTKDYLDLIDPAQTFNLLFIYRDPDIGDLTTPAFNTVHADYGRDFRLYTFFRFDSGVTLKEFLFIFQGATGNSSLLQQLEYNVDADRNRLIFINKGLVNGAPIDPSGQPFLNLLTDPEGFYVENLGSVTRFTNQIYTLTSVSNPAIRMGFYHILP